MNLNELGKRVKIARINADLTQKALGEMVGLHQTEICRIERGERELTVAKLTAVAQALGVETIVLLEGAEQDKAA